MFRKIRLLLILLGLWAPDTKGCAYWCLRNIYPIFIYFLILYPWTTFITQEAYWSIPVFLFINLHLSGIFAYHSARKYWKQIICVFITSTFIPYHDDLTEFQQNYKKHSEEIKSEIITDNESEDKDVWDSERKTLAQGFKQRYRKDNRENKRNAGLRTGTGTSYEAYDDDNGKQKNKRKNKREKSDDDIYTYDINESLKNIRKCTADPFKKHKFNLSWSSIAGSENKLSVSLFYEGIYNYLFEIFRILYLIFTFSDCSNTEIMVEVLGFDAVDSSTDYGDISI